MTHISVPVIAFGVWAVVGASGLASAGEMPIAPPADASKPTSAKADDRIGVAMVEAETSLKAGNGQNAASAQEQVIAELDALLQAAASGGSSSNGSTMQPDASDQAANPMAGSDKTSEPSPSRQENRSQQTEAGNNAESASPEPKSSKADDSSKTPQAPPEERPLPFPARFDRADGAWGHLPPRLRDQLRNAASDRFLPSYDALMRGYYESLSDAPLRSSSPDPEPPRSTEIGGS